jgi:hypothetical protein|tara:strand:+ start:186 stop:977 length:792 start_codon:yes stop_codon:yes gene_type:complete
MSVRNIFSAFDRVVMGGRIRLLYKKYQENALYSHKSNLFNYGFIGEYIKNDNSTLNVLADRYGSDKGEVSNEGNPYYWASHSYADIYELMFRLRRNDVELVLECGLGTNNPNLISSMEIDGKPGASLRLWRDFFPNAQIIGIDIDSDILFEDDRIRTFECDQTSSDGIENFCRLASLSPSSIDVIIDDGLHEFHAGISLFEGMSKYLAKDGIYVIEDIIPNDYIAYKDYFVRIQDKFTVQMLNLQRPNLSIRDNRLIIIRHVA